jgi:hypothetical protein
MTQMDWRGCHNCRSGLHLRYKRAFWFWHEIECTNCGHVLKIGGTREQAEAFIASARWMAEGFGLKRS